jgi:hypothetical protein
MRNRDEIIKQLALAHGISNTNDIQSRYDKGTGTLYCNGRRIKREELEHVKTFLQKQIAMFENNLNLDGAMDKLIAYKVSYTAVCFLQDSLNDNN